MVKFQCSCSNNEKVMALGSGTHSAKLYPPLSEITLINVINPVINVTTNGLQKRCTKKVSNFNRLMGQILTEKHVIIWNNLDKMSEMS